MSDKQYKVLRSLDTKGTVTLAENTDDGRKYVLKELTDESVTIYRRISELPPLENLMQIYDIIRQDGQNTAVCEYTRGQPLNELLDGGRMFPAKAVVQVISQLCRAAEHLHDHGIIHRDITPKNIILDENLNLKLIDYDISRSYRGYGEQDTTLYGTEGFAAPEQYGFRETGFTADIYSIGVILRLLLNTCPDCPPAQELILRRIAAKCTRLSPEKRYRSAGKVRRAVSRSSRVVPVGITAASAVFLAVIAAAVLTLQNVSRKTPPAVIRDMPSSSAETSNTTAAPVTLVSSDTTHSYTTAQPTEAASIQTTQTTQTTCHTQTTRPTQPTTQTTTFSAIITTPAVSTSVSASVQTTASTTGEPTLLPELHTSDMDNPEKISFTTVKNDRGYYEDVLEYVFYDDLAVHGEWSFCNAIAVDELTCETTADFIQKQRFSGSNIFSSLSIMEDGGAVCILPDGTEMPCSSCWTNGFLICDYVEGRAAQRLFAATIDGEDFLFLAVKTGDFSRNNMVLIYEVYTRAE